jgi:hypothetical protein
LNPRSLSYEPHDENLCRPEQSLVTALTLAGLLWEVASGPSLSDSHETSGTYEISVAKQGETGPLRQ